MTDFRKKSNTNFHEILFSGSRVTLCGQKNGRTNRHDEMDGQTGMMKPPIVAFRYLAEAPKIKV